jgi:hypothetical protein
MLRSLLLIIGLGIVVSSSAQDRYFTKSGKISFYSKTNVEDIEAHNRSVTCVLDTKTGNVQFAVLMKGFEFKKALMQEHFNESYIESDKYPKSVFKGQVTNNSEIDYSKNGTYPAKVKGQLTIHGETKEVDTDGTITVKDGNLHTTAEFQVAIADYKISVPALVKDNISKTITIKVSCILEPLK